MSAFEKAAEICDPLYGHIYFDRDEKRLIESPAFQRLRSIQQLGFCQYAFPSGTGNRLTHSLGAGYLAGAAFDSIFSKPAARALSLREARKKEFRKALRFAALLHDVGHGPLSHSSEPLMPRLSDLKMDSFWKAPPDRQACHEDYSAKLIMETGLSEIIRGAGVEPLAVAQLLHQNIQGGEDFFQEGGLNYLPLFRQIISSELDVDRMDYLNRDSLFCGVKYGLTDFMWLLSHFDCHIEGDQALLAIGSEALYTIESFLLGRRHMRMIVYFHHKTVIYAYMLKKYAASCGWTLPADTEAYLLFEDGGLFQRLRETAEGNEWARRISRREPYIRLYDRLALPGGARGESPFQKEARDRFDLLEEELKGEGIPLIKIDSEKHIVKPPGELRGAYEIFLKSRGFNRAMPLFGGGRLLSLPSERIERVYAAPEKLERAKQILSRAKKKYADPV